MPSFVRTAAEEYIGPRRFWCAVTAAERSVLSVILAPFTARRLARMLRRLSAGSRLHSVIEGPRRPSVSFATTLTREDSIAPRNVHVVGDVAVSRRRIRTMICRSRSGGFAALVTFVGTGKNPKAAARKRINQRADSLQSAIQY